MIELDLQNALESDSEGLPTEADFLHWVETALNECAAKPDEAQLTIRLVEEAEITELNATYRHQNKPTNVLSFPYEAMPGVDIPLLGDIVICAAVVAQEAAEQEKPLQAHWAHMVIHGTLHLLGYDHIEEDEAELMEGLEIALLGSLGYANPYN
jgi:probable rRNA maturation factor